MRKSKGITLIALVITIIILLILAGITIATLTGENGVLKKSKSAEIKTKKEQYREEINLIIIDSQMEIYKGSKETLKKLVKNKIEKQSWFQNFDETNTEENKLIVHTKDNFEIEIQFEGNKANIIDIIYGENKQEINKNTKINVTYQGNGGILSNQDETFSIEVEKNSTIVLLENSFYNKMYDFEAWVDENGREYQAGEKYEVKETNLVLKAKWKYKIQEEISYLRTTGNQYIDTGYVANQNTSIEIKFQLLSRKNQFLYGSRKKANELAYSLGYGNLGVTGGAIKECFRSDYDTKQELLTILGYENIQVIKQEKNKVFHNNNLIYTHPYVDFTAGGVEKNNLYLFHINENGNVNNRNGC